MEQTLNDDFRDMIGLLNEEQVDYLLIGGWAVSFHARQRMTDDIDFWVRPTVQNAERVLRALIRFGAPIESLNISTDDFALPHRGVQMGRPPVRIDFLTSMLGVDFESAWRKHIVRMLSGVEVKVIGRDDLLTNKLQVGRDKDLWDAEAIKRASQRDAER